MGIEENKAVVRRFMAAAMAGDSSGFDEICAPDFVNHAAPQRPGLQGMKDVVAFSTRMQPDQRLVEQHWVAEGDLVVLYGVRAATWKGTEFRGIATPEGEVSVEMAHMFRIQDGMICEHWAVRDDLGMMQQLGAL
ncbi:ester cyclase [Kribbella sp. NPDC056951]|uniref:ester cyclase n=1 Tax=Kribbella sp. NPDC056951 TaxID=3345978 RepID=UPI003639AA3E